MKRTFLLTFLIMVEALTSTGQTLNDIITLKVGFTSTNIVFNEAFEPSIRVFGTVFNPGKVFSGDGLEVGLSKDINSKLFVDLSFVPFSGKATKIKLNTNENYYTLNGYQLPLTLNYLLRNDTKKLRINAGAGIQYLKGHLQQFETITNGSGSTTTQIANISIGELQFIFKPGVQFRVIKNLFISFMVKIAISTNGRYSDNPSFSIKYSFRNRKHE